MRLFGGRNSKLRKRTRLGLKPRTLFCERLEDRLVLSNIAVADAYLVDRTGTNPLSDVVIGQKVGVRLDWTTTDLPGNIADYQVEFRVDGVPLRSNDDNFGAGLASGTFVWFRIGWYASPGTHTVEIIVDVDNEVLESNESDNSITFDFTPVTANFPQLMTWPLELGPLTEVFLTNYNDVDPTSGVSDFQGGNATYNTHNAIDSGPATFAGQDQGIEIHAALDGVVKSINDGEFDRQASSNSSPSNHVIIDHGNGWETLYLHMRRDSVQVEVGQTVSQGDRLGLVGSSGSSTISHIHFELRRHGLPVETYYEPSTYWVSPVDYVFENVYLVDSGITNYNPGGGHFWDGPSDSHILAQQSGIKLYARGYYSGLRVDDHIESRWFRPNFSFFVSRSLIIGGDFTSSGWFWGAVSLPNTPDLGTWRVVYYVNGSFLGQEFFEVTLGGAPEIRVEEPNGDIVTDGRFTPFDFGVANLGAASPTHTFTVINHGYDTLTIDSLEVPTGYTVTDGLVASLAPGASDTLTVALDTSAGGYFGGVIRIASNDVDEPVYDFAVEGIVTSAGVKNLIVGIGEFEVVEGGQMVANIRRTGNTAGAVTVSLSTDDITELSLPATVSFAPGEDYVQFFLDAPSDFMIDGNQEVVIVASAIGYYSGRKTVDVVDDRQQTGDFTGDGLVNGADFLAWQRGMSPNPLSASDLNDWEENYGNPPPPANISTPEPLTTVLPSDNAAASLSEPDAFPFINAPKAITSFRLAQVEAEVIDQVFETMSPYDELADPSTILEIRPLLLRAPVNDEATLERELPLNEHNLYDFDNLFATLATDTEFDSLTDL